MVKVFAILVQTLTAAAMLGACVPVASTPPATATATLPEATSTPMASDLISYADSVFGFSLLYPAEGTLSIGGELRYPSD